MVAPITFGARSSRAHSARHMSTEANLVVVAGLAFTDDVTGYRAYCRSGAREGNVERNGNTRAHTRSSGRTQPTRGRPHRPRSILHRIDIQSTTAPMSMTPPQWNRNLPLWGSCKSGVVLYRIDREYIRFVFSVESLAMKPDRRGVGVGESSCLVVLLRASSSLPFFA
jgi:hypothetical protein